MAQNSEVKIRIKVEGIEDNLTKLAKLELELAAINKEMAAAKKINDLGAYTEFRKQQDEIKDSIKGVSGEIREQKKLLERTDFAEGSYRDLNAQLVELRASYKDLSEAERESEIGKATLENIQGLDTKLKEIDATLGQFQRNVGNYEGAIAKALEDAGVKGALERRIKNLREEQEKLKNEAKELANAYVQASASGSADLQQLERQILDNQQAQQNLNNEIRQSGSSGSFTEGLTRLGGNIPFFGEIADAFSQGGELAGAFGGRIAALGPVIGAAFGAFAVGGVVYKALDIVAGLGNEFGKLEGAIAGFSGASGFELDNLAVEVKSIAETFGATTDEVNLAANSLSKGFGIDFAKSLELVKKGFLSGANAGGQLIDNLEEYAPLIKNAGYNAEEFVAIIAQQAQGGTYNDKLIDSIKEVGLSFGELTKASQDALKPLGEDFANTLIKNLNNGSVSAAQALKLIEEQGKKVGLSVSEIGTITADVFRGAGEDAGGYLRVLQEVNLATSKGLDGFIDQSNYATKAAQATLQANKELASAQAGIANIAGDLGISWDLIGTKILTVITNIAKNVLLYSNEIKIALIGLAAVFGGPVTMAVIGFGALMTGVQDPINKTRESARQLSEQLSEQQKKVTDLEKNVSPLVKRYEELQKQSELNKVSGKDNTQVQNELLNVMRELGEAVPTAVSEFNEYGQALKINTKEVNDYLKGQQETLSSIREAKNSKDIELLIKYKDRVSKITKEISDQQEELNKFQKYATEKSALFNSYVDTPQKIEEIRNKIIALGKDLGEAGSEAANLEKSLKLSSGGKFDLTAAQKGYTNAIKERLAGIALEYKVEDDAKNEKIKIQKELTAEQKKAAEDAAKQRKADADRRAKEAEAERKRIQSEYEQLLKAAGVSEAAYRAAINKSKDDTTKLSLDQIKDRFEKERKLNAFNFNQQKAEIAKGLQQQSNDLIEQYKAEIEFIRKNPAYASRFGSKAEIQELIKGVTAETKTQIAAQTGELANAYKQQQIDLEKAKQEAFRAAKQAVQEGKTENDVTAAANIQANVQAQINAVNSIYEIRDKKITESYNAELLALNESLTNKEISEKTYNEKVKALDYATSVERLKNTKSENEELQSIYDKQIEANMELLRLQYQQSQAQAAEDLRKAKKDAEDKTETGARGGDPVSAKALELAEIENAQKAHDERMKQLGLKYQQDQAGLVDTRIKQEVDGNTKLLQSAKDTDTQKREATKEHAALMREIVAESLSIANDVSSQAFDLLKQSSDQQAEEQTNLINARFEKEKEQALGNVELIEQAEKRKSEAQRRANEETAARNKSLALSQAIVNAALSITSILAQYPKFDGGFAMAAALIASGVANAAAIAKIATTKYAQGGVLGIADVSDGAVNGASHLNGGIKIRNANGTISEVEGGESIQTDEFGRKVVINKYSSRLFAGKLSGLRRANFMGKSAILSGINSYGGLGKKFANGGVLTGRVPQLQAPNVRAGSSDNFGVFQNNMATLQENNLMLQAYIEATNARMDRLTVLTDATDLYKKGLKGYESKQIDIID